MTSASSKDDAGGSGRAGKRREKDSSAANSAAAKRRKVAKACLFCKRSHMTCTENRPCDRCIKRDIAHLCTDAPTSTPKRKGKESSEEHVLDNEDSAIMSGNGLEDLSTTIEAGPSRTSPPISSSSNQIPPLISPVITTHTLTQSPSQKTPTSLPTLLSESQPPPLHHQNSNSSQNNDTNNPFALLNQAYDFSYPQNNSLSNSTLASLRLFATTADAQFGPFGNNNYANLSGNGQNHDNSFANGTLGLLGANPGSGWSRTGPGVTTGSDAGSGSDIDANALDDFLRSLDEMYLNPLPDVPQAIPTPTSAAPTSLPSLGLSQHQNQNNQNITAGTSSTATAHPSPRLPASLLPHSGPPSRSMSPIMGGHSGPGGNATPSSSTERFLLTAADQKDGTRDERLNKVIRAKYEAGLLKPFNYIKGYERLNTWMDSKWASTSKHRTLKIISEFRPAFRAIAQSLTDMDLIYIEEAFERLLLNYDRVFSTMGIPACLWRRTGEIFKGNREFADLIGVPYEHLRDGKLAISELMTEDSAVNFWEKYGSIAFDPGQKAVLTSCVLVHQAILKGEEERKKSQIRRHSNSGSAFDNNDFLTPSSSYPPNVPKEALITCTFSFTIRRDAYHIPTAIVGNFMSYKPK